MELVERWWNSRWGRLSRRDVYLYSDGTGWRVEAREGGADGRRKTWDFDTEQEARAFVERCLDDGLGGWKRLDMWSRPRS